MTSPSDSAPVGRAHIVGCGLIGGSIGLGLRQRGWFVTGTDRDHDRARRAAEIGALDDATEAEAPDITFIATPVGVVVEAARAALDRGGGLVTDVGSVKSTIAGGVEDSRFVPGHPMAGSEQEGLDGSDANLFEGATWVLTPTPKTDPDAYARVRAVVSSLGADVVAIDPARHDDLVALVSHVPHLAAATLMRLAASGAEEHATVLRLAAGGFRDMTRIAAGHPGIWPDICAENRSAIVTTLDRFVATLMEMRDLVAHGDRGGLLDALEAARTARISLPAGAARAEDLVEMRIPVPDRPGVIAEVTTLAGELDVNIEDLEIAHSAEGNRGVLLVVIDARAADLLRGALFARGYRPSTRALAS